jgi:hypothetical protein
MYAKKGKQYIQMLQLEYFHQNYRTFALSFNPTQITYNSTVYTNFSNQPGLC